MAISWLKFRAHRGHVFFSSRLLLQSTISSFVTKKYFGEPISTGACNVNEAPVRIVLPFKDQRSANSARRQLGELGCKIGIDIRPVYTSCKIGHEIKPKEKKPPIINQQLVVYHYKCGLCDANYVGYTMYVMTPLSAR